MKHNRRSFQFMTATYNVAPSSFWNLAQSIIYTWTIVNYTLFHLVSSFEGYIYELRPRSCTWKYVTAYYDNKAVNGVQGCRWVFLHGNRRRSSIYVREDRSLHIIIAERNIDLYISITQQTILTQNEKLSSLKD